jgi:CheY-like chemotaxis protein
VKPLSVFRLIRPWYTYASREHQVADSFPPSCAGIRVLVVDDNEDARDILATIFGYAGAWVRVAASAREAVAMLDEVDVVVTDYSMPGDTGLWLLERVLERPGRVPVIAVTGYTDTDIAELAAAPFARVLRKPLDPWTLCREVRDATGRD